MDNRLKKKEIRTKYLEKRAQISMLKKKQFDTSLNQKLIDLLIDPALKVIHAFLPMKKEVNIYPFINVALDKERTVVCPKSLPGGTIENYILTSLQEVEKGIFGTSYPSNSSIYSGKIDLIIVPGLAYAADGDRLGYGGGYYDRFLVKYKTALKVAAAYDFQMVDSLPTESHDIKVDQIILP